MCMIVDVGSDGLAAVIVYMYIVCTCTSMCILGIHKPVTIVAVCCSVKKLREQFIDITLDDSEVTAHAHISELCDDCAEVSYCYIV